MTTASWNNWAKNLSYATTSPDPSYVTPRTRKELCDALADAVRQRRQVRVSGQRHSQPALVANRTDENLVLIDLSCYADLGDGGQRIVLDGNRVTVNSGVREDELEAFLGQNQRMLKTVTAGGFFSVGGMTAVDVHGATTEAPIFAETALSFTIVCADGVAVTIDGSTPGDDGWRPLQFARVSLGALGVVTSMTLEVLPRPHRDSIVGSTAEYSWSSEASFAAGLASILASTTRVETFFNPYADLVFTYPFLVCGWNVQDGSGPAPDPSSVPNACQLASKGEFGAPLLGIGEPIAEAAALAAQEAYEPALAWGVTAAAMKLVKDKVDAANLQGSELWLDDAARAVFMSYFIELPDLGPRGLGIVWRALNSVRQKVKAAGNFHIAAPMEFRFVKGGDSALAGTYSSQPETYFVNLDLVAFAAENATKDGLDYQDGLLRFFSEIEREWVALGGQPHNGKMYGFYDPAGAPGNYGPPFNPAFVSHLREQRRPRVQAFNTYRRKLDPNGVFSNSYLRALLGE